MTNPIKNNQVPPPATDPYAKNYGTGGPEPDPYAEYGYDPGMGGDEYGMDGGYEDEFIGGDYEGGEPGGAPTTYTANELRDMVKAVKDQLTPEQYNSLLGRINLAASMSPDKMQAEFAKIAGDLNAVVNPASAEGGEGVEGNEETVERDAKKKELEEYLKAVNDNPDIPSDLKDEAKEKIEKWIKGMELGTITMETIEEELDNLKNQISDATAFPPTFQKLSELTGKEPAELEKLFEKHGLDPKNLPSPPDGKVAALLNDPEFSSTLGDLRSTVKDDYKKLKDQIDSKISEANSRNSSARAATSQKNDNWAPFEELQKIFEHKDDLSKNLAGDMKKLADETGKILSAMYGTTVTASTDEAKPGIIVFNGTEMNCIQNPSSGDISFSSDLKVGWPEFTRPAVAADCEGDGAVDLPDWMEQANYPHESYDGGFQWHYSS